MRFSDLVKKYQRLHAIRTSPFCDETAEETVLVHETDRIRILLVRSLRTQKIRMEVEVNILRQMCGLNGNFTTNQFSSDNQPALQRFLREMIMLFQYLLDLHEFGFHLDFFSDESVWIASYDMDQAPDKRFFTQVQPPSTLTP